MSTLLLGTLVPDYPGSDQEICHLFSVNFIIQKNAGNIVKYAEPNNGTDSITFLKNAIQQFNLQVQPVGGIIKPGDLIVIGNGRSSGRVACITHSMIAIDQNNWFGVNNMGTFGIAYKNKGVPFRTLQERRDVIPGYYDNLNFNNYTFGEFTFDVYR